MIQEYDLWNTPTPPLSCGKPFFSHSLQPSADFLCSQFECNYSEICVLFYWLPGGRAGTVFPDFSTLWSYGMSPSPSGAVFWDLHCMIAFKLQRSPPQHPLETRIPRWVVLDVHCSLFYISLSLFVVRQPSSSPSESTLMFILLDFFFFAAL